MNANDFDYILGMAGVVAFAVTAVLAVTSRGTDLFGTCVLALMTTIGGGTVRDVILGVPVFWSLDLNYIWVTLIASVITFYGNRFISRRRIYRLMLYIDALGVSMFAIQASEKVQLLGFAMPLGPILLGMLTAIGGGLIRDVLAGRDTLLLSKELYAIPVTIGCTLQVILAIKWPEHIIPISTGCVVLTFIMRSSAIYWNLHVPRWMTIQAKQS